MCLYSIFKHVVILQIEKYIFLSDHLALIFLLQSGPYVTAARQPSNQGNRVKNISSKNIQHVENISWDSIKRQVKSLATRYMKIPFRKTIKTMPKNKTVDTTFSEMHPHKQDWISNQKSGMKINHEMSECHIVASIRDFWNVGKWFWRNFALSEVLYDWSAYLKWSYRHNWW